MSDTGGTRAEDAAYQTFVVETITQQLETRNASFEDRFRNAERNPFRGWRPPSHVIRNFLFLDAVLDGEFRGLFDCNGFIKGTGYLVPDEYMQTLAIDDARLVRSLDERTVIIGCNVAHANYFHWIAQALPAIDVSIRRHGKAQSVVLALPPLNRWQKDSLRLLGHEEVSLTTIDDLSKQYAYRKIEYSDLICGGAAFWISEEARRTYATLRGSVSRPLAQARRIYVARTDTPSRQMLNEGVLIEALRRRGFEIVVPGQLALAEQIQLFRSASLVVGTHGAGMTNLVFCDPEAVIYELLPSHYTNACFCNLAHTCQLNYWADAFESDGEGLPNLRPWSSDTGAVLDRIDELDAIIATIGYETQTRTISAMDYLKGMPGEMLKAGSGQQPTLPPPSKGWLRRLWGTLVNR